MSRHSLNVGRDIRHARYCFDRQKSINFSGYMPRGGYRL